MGPLLNFFKNFDFGPLFPLPEEKEQQAEKKVMEPAKPAETTAQKAQAASPPTLPPPPAPPPLETRSFSKIKEDFRKQLVTAFTNMGTSAEDLEGMSLDARIQSVKGAFLEAFEIKIDSDLFQLLDGKKVTFKNQESKVKQTLFQEAADTPKKIFAGQVVKKHKEEVTGRTPRFDVNSFSPVVKAYLAALGRTESEIAKLLQDRQKVAMQLHFVRDEIKKELKRQLGMIEGSGDETIPLQNEIIIDDILNDPDKLLQEYTLKRNGEIKTQILEIHFTQSGVSKDQLAAQITQHGDATYKKIANKKGNPEQVLKAFLEKTLVSLSKFDGGSTSIENIEKKVQEYVVQTTGMKEEKVAEELQNRSKLFTSYQEMRRDFSALKNPQSREKLATKLPMTEVKFKALCTPEKQSHLKLFLKENEQVNTLLLQRLAKEYATTAGLSLIQKLWLLERTDSQNKLLTDITTHFFEALRGFPEDKAKAIQFYAYLQHHTSSPHLTADWKARYSSLLQSIESVEGFRTIQGYL